MANKKQVPATESEVTDFLKTIDEAVATLDESLSDVESTAKTVTDEELTESLNDVDEAVKSLAVETIKRKVKFISTLFTPSFGYRQGEEAELTDEQFELALKYKSIEEL